MRNLEEIKKRIKSVDTTLKITFAMQMVATAKLQRFKQTYATYSDYLNGFYHIFSNIYNDKNHDIIISNQILYGELNYNNPKLEKTLWIVIGSDIGMCGGFNSAIVKQVEKLIKKQDQLFLFGNKIETLLLTHLPNAKIIENFDHIENNLEPEFIFVLAQRMLKLFFKDKFTHLKIVHTKYINSLLFHPEIVQFLPFTPDYFKTKVENEKLKELNLNEYELSQTPSHLISKIIYHYFGALVYGGIIESKISESSARYNAMLTATDNANELIENYQLEYNRIRQSSITQEIIEIISGSNT